MHIRIILGNLHKRLILTLLAMIVFLFGASVLSANEYLSEVKTVRVNNYDMSYVERGKGTPLILVHGSLSDYRTWLPLLEEFSETNRVIAVSLRHYYPEHWNGKGSDLSLQQHVDDLSAFIDTLNSGPVFLLGHSRGGAVALLMASKHPEQVNRLILADPTPLTSMLLKHQNVQTEAGIRKAKLQEIMQYFQVGDTESGLKEFVSYVAGPKAWERTSDERRNVLRSNMWTIISLLNDIDTPFSCSNAGNLSLPVLLVTGERSASLYGHMNAVLNTCLKYASNAVIADAGHLMFQANPTAFIFEVQEFIAPQ